MTRENTQDNKLKKLVQTAQSNALYGDLYCRLGRVERFSDVPLLEETHFRNANFAALKEKNEGAMCVYFTSGTTAQPKAIYRNLNDIEHQVEYIRWFCEVEGIAGGERVAVLMGQSFWGAGYLTVQGHRKAGNTVLGVDTELPKNVISTVVRRFRPTVISSIPSVLIDLKDILKNPHLKVLETTGEVLRKRTRNYLETYFHSEVFDAYGLTEGLVGVECAFHDGYHFLQGRIHLEVIDPQTEQVLLENTWGELVMTVLSDSIMPVIRYRTGDICKVSFERCNCGNDTPRVWIRRRLEGSITLYGGSKISLAVLRSAIYECCGTSVRFRIEARRRGDLTVLSVKVKGGSKENLKFLESRIKNLSYEMMYLSRVKKVQVICFSV